MKKMTRILCVLLSVLMVAAVFAACDKKPANDTSSVADVTSVAPPAVVVETADEYKIAEGTTIVTVITDNQTNVTTMRVAENTTLKQLLEVVTPSEGYKIRITDAEGKEVTDETAIIANDFNFEVIKDGETTAAISHKIVVVTEEQIKQVISEAEAEQSRVQSQLAEASKAGEASRINSAVRPNQGGGGGGSTGGGISMTSRESKPDDAYSFVFRTHRSLTGTTAEYITKALNDKADELGYTMDIGQDANVLTASVIQNAIMSGSKYADLFETTSGVARELAKAGAITPLNGSFNLNASWLSKGVSDTLTYAGNTYGIAPSGLATAPMGVTFNKSLIATYAPSIDVYDMYKKKTWTAEAYTELMKETTRDIDGNGTTDIFGMTSNTNVIGIALSSFSGGTDAKDPSTGYIYPCFTTEAGIASLNWCKNATVNGYWKYIADIYSSVNFFAAGSAATVVTYMWAVENAASSADFEIGFVPFPIAGNQKDYVSQTYNTSAFCVPVTGKENISKAAAVFEAFGGINNDLINESANGYSAVGLDDTGISVYRWCVTNMTADYSGGVHDSTVGSAIDNSCISKSKDPATEMAAIADKAQNQCNDWYGKLTGQPSNWKGPGK